MFAEQVWKGLQRKIRRAQDFVGAIKGTDVVDDKEDEVVRIAHFADGHDVKEVCKSYWPTKVGYGLSEKAPLSLTNISRWTFISQMEHSSPTPFLTDHPFPMRRCT